MLIEYIYEIHDTLNIFFIDLKTKYLNKSLIKYIEKINLPYY